MCNFLCKLVKEIGHMHGGVLLYAAQAIPPIDAEIAEKGHSGQQLSQQVQDRAHRRSGFGPESKVPLVDFADDLIGVLR